ncbi:hypothetical protein Zmor_021856 [Zophobas morio]|uniref:Uncharacterized protein n=2 Tax=Zophobas morio TaxID=2755281 RepID=A0AA38I774_9CUCU|nr:hypothetical protein Zmor_021856 [Zophobas morio]
MKFLILFILLAYHFKNGLTANPNTKQNFCQNNRCLTCIGRYCTTTCEGEGCKNCPLGDCCDGTNCNICRGEKCCSTMECNTCIHECLKQCQGTASCHYDCFQQCIPNGENGADETNDNQINRSPGSSLISNKNYLPVNVTTIINITNTIHNENQLHNPIFINTTNVNNYTGQNSYHRKQVQISTNTNNSDIDIVKSENINQQNCCEVIHPEICRSYSQNVQLCYTRKHDECSALCTGRHIHIVENKNQKARCIGIATDPYWYCGQYIVENCDNCYNCTDIDDTECTQNPDCSDACRSGLIAKEFYNKLYRKE